ncbi:ImmA/IrrE family metallo-endopeptidase [Catenuloplanes japonicus]|uniref:ImmA/IrrE family metallo-endopeptidase n=1 Tax=Catenuloplanes japonicus TaxID=33876 RepID=UPI00052739F9|nr:ImmA/IrrE family metallo-endopeptidase [Catenuloplanes japonicus]
MTAELERQAAEAAARFRADHHLGVQPLGDLVAIVEQTTGIDVAVLEAGPDEHGLTMRDRARGTVFIGVARTPHPMRQRSTLAHELGHVQFGDWEEGGPGGGAGRAPAEARADSFARHLLVPAEGLKEFLDDQQPISESTLSAVVQRFLVSPALAAIALRQAGYIDADRAVTWRGIFTPQLAVRHGWQDQYRALQADSDRRRAPQRLLARAIRGYAEGVLSAQAVATLRGVPLPEVEAELRDAGVVPAATTASWADPADLPDVDVDLAALDEALDGSDDSRGTDDAAQGPR